MLTRIRKREDSITGSQSSQEDSAPKEEYVPPIKRRKPASAHPSQWVCVVPVDFEKHGNSPEKPSFVSLRDPRTGSPRRYLVNCCGTGTEICEVLKFSDEPRSWFIGNSVQTDGSLHICTPVDPLFLTLPYLIKGATSGKFTTLDTLLEDAEFSCSILERCVSSEQWQHVCDMKVLQSGMAVYRYSQEKTLQWLKKKVEALSEKLRDRGVYVGAGSRSATFVRSHKQSDVSQEDYLRYASGIVCDYLPKQLAAELATAYEKQSEIGNKSTDNSCEPPAKKQSAEDGEVGGLAAGEPLEDYTKFNTADASKIQAKAVKLTPAQKALAKVDKKGMRSLTSFFGSKTSKTSKTSKKSKS